MSDMHTYVNRRILFTACMTALFLLMFALVAEAQDLRNPLNPTFSSVPAFIAGTLKALVMIALPIITLFFVYSGFLFVSAGGNEGQITKAKNNFVYVVIGALLILSAWILATLIASTVNQLTGNP